MEDLTHRVYYSLLRLYKNKAPGPDRLPNWFFKEFAEILSDPVTDILNSSFKEKNVLTGWKLANVTARPEGKQVHHPQKELRPISLTPALSKIAEDFVVTDYIKPAMIKSDDPNQFGTIPGSSTVMALINMVHKWLGGTHETGAKIRVLLCDFRKSFDLIDHSLLTTKLKRLDIPSSIVNWVIRFLTCRLQRVKLGQECFSEWGTINSRVPQGTKLCPWLFFVMINDFTVPDPFNIWKFLDDSTVSETILKGEKSNSQLALNEVNDWSKKNFFQLKGDKTKEMIINFNRLNEESCHQSI